VTPSGQRDGHASDTASLVGTAVHFSDRYVLELGENGLQVLRWPHQPWDSPPFWGEIWTLLIEEPRPSPDPQPKVHSLARHGGWAGAPSLPGMGTCSLGHTPALKPDGGQRWHLASQPLSPLDLGLLLFSFLAIICL
jgi:hypothetical protein